MNRRVFQAILSASRRWHVKAYLVGGPVRDRLLGIPCQDLDWACPKAKSMAQSVARRLKAKLIALDEQNRIYRVILPPGIGRLTLDFAELQGKTIEQDLARRDFTINAMASELDQKEVIDPFKGQNDLQKKIIRALSPKAFAEDPLRLLRAFRFSAQFGFAIEPQTMKWIKEGSFLFAPSPLAGEGGDEGAQIENTSPHPRPLPQGERGFKAVSAERVREEFLRLVSQARAASTLFAMDRAGLLTAIFPELEAGRRVALGYYGRGGVVKHALQSVAALEWILSQTLGFVQNEEILQKLRDYVRTSMGGFPRWAFLKLAALLHDVGKPATAEVIQGRLRFFGHEDVGANIAQKAVHRLRFSRKETQRVRGWVQNHMRLGNLASVPLVTDKAIARFFRDLGDDGAGMLLVSLADHYTYLSSSRWGKGKDPVEQTIHLMLERYYMQREKVLPSKLVDGHLLMRKLRLKPGPIIGKLLELIQDAQAEGLVVTPEQAIALVKRKMNSLSENTHVIARSEATKQSRE